MPLGSATADAGERGAAPTQKRREGGKDATMVAAAARGRSGGVQVSCLSVFSADDVEKGDVRRFGRREHLGGIALQQEARQEE